MNHCGISHPNDITPGDWAKILEEIAEGFEAYLRWVEDYKEEDKVIFDKGMNLFVKHFVSLWD